MDTIKQPIGPANGMLAKEWLLRLISPHPVSSTPSQYMASLQEMSIGTSSPVLVKSGEAVGI